jgi:hypothetical protein
MTGRFKVPAWVALVFILPAIACIITFRVAPIFVSAGGSLMTTSLTGESSRASRTTPRCSQRRNSGTACA